MILLIDCSKGLRLIIGNKQRILVNKSKPRLKKVSERLTVEIKILLDSIKKDYQNLSKIIVINGPGSFTGIRTGITAAKVLGLSLKLPVYGISLFELLCINYLKTKPKKNLKFLIKLNKDNYFAQNINFIFFLFEIFFTIAAVIKPCIFVHVWFCMRCILSNGMIFPGYWRI